MVDVCCGSGGLDKLATLAPPTRNRYFYGKLLDAFHCDLEQDYFNRKRWLLNRLGLGAGVLCGLAVEMSSDKKQVRVGSGVAIDDFGREIVVTEWAPAIDPRQPTDACGKPVGDPVQGAGQVTLCVTYYECAVEPVPVLVADCDTERGCAPSAIRERYRLQIRAGLPGRPPGLITAAQCAAIFPESAPAGFNHRHTACETLKGDCPMPDDECVVLATIDLAADGTIAAIDTCAFRSVVYSNAVLLDLILCLAARVDACCAGGGPPATPAPGTPAPTTPPPTTPPPTGTTFRISSVQFLNLSDESVREIENPGEIVELSAEEQVASIRFVFDEPVNLGTVQAGGADDDPRTFSLLVQAASSSEPLKFVPGVITSADATITRFGIAPDTFPADDYQVTLFGDPDPEGLRPAITSMSGKRLDGEPGPVWPSGDGTEGGNFVFKFNVVNVN